MMLPKRGIQNCHKIVSGFPVVRFLFTMHLNFFVTALLKAMHILCITVLVGRSRSVKNAADTTAFFKAHICSNA